MNSLHFESSIQRPHVVTVPYPAQGHFHPLICLSRKLAELGCMVTIVNIHPVHDLLQQFFFPSELHIRLESLNFDLPTPNGVVAAFHANPRGFTDALSNLAGEFERLIGRLNIEGPTVSCIVADHLIGDMSWSVSSKHRIRHATYWPGSAAWCSVDFHVPMLLSEGALPVTDSDISENAKLIYIPGLGHLKPSDLPGHAHVSVLPIFGHEAFDKGAHRLKSSAWILANSVYELEPTTLDAAKRTINEKFISVGPLFPIDKDDEYDDSRIASVLSPRAQNCLHWLDMQAPASVLYISYGSIASLSAREFQELAKGLEASQVSFLWVIRAELVKDLPEEIYNGFIKRTKDKGNIVVSSAPQREVLAHASISGFLTHCGWNSIMESVSAGVPMLAWPCVYDQMINRKLIVEDWKIGLGFSKDKDGLVTKEEVERVVRAFLAGQEEMSERAGQLGLAAKQAARKGGSSHSNLLAFVDDLKTKVASMK